MQKCLEAVRKLVVASRETAKLLEPVKEPLDEIASFVSIPVEVSRSDAVTARGNDGLRSRAGNCFHEAITVVSLVGHHGVGWDGFDQRRTHCDVGNLRARQVY